GVRDSAQEMRAGVASSNGSSPEREHGRDEHADEQEEAEGAELRGRADERAVGLDAVLARRELAEVDPGRVVEEVVRHGRERAEADPEQRPLTDRVLRRLPDLLAPGACARAALSRRL